MLAGLGADDLLDLRLDRVVAIGAECGRDLGRERLRALLERLPEAGIELTEPLLELAADVVDVRGRLLAVEHPAADLDRLAHGLGRRASGGGAIAHQAGGARIVDLEPLDHQTVVEGAHGAAVGVVAERELWSFGCFHVDSRK